jgi:hypothetical protein
VVELVVAYDDARRRYAEKKFARDMQRARLEWLREGLRGDDGRRLQRRWAVDAPEDLARKGQEVREMTRDLDLIKVDVDVIAMVARLRGAHVAGAKADEAQKAPRARTAEDRVHLTMFLLCSSFKRGLEFCLFHCER